MGQITTGVGLASGLPTGKIIDQLIAIEAKPEKLIKQHNTELQSQETALKSINARLLSLKLAAGNLTSPTSFSQTKAASSDESVLSATGSAGATPGNYRFTVHQLASAQQTVTRGFADRDATAIAPDLPAGQTRTLTFERGESRLETTTRLSQLNGGEGIHRGGLRITDRSGASAVVDLSSVATLDEVVDKINNTDGVNVRAAIEGEGLALHDQTGQSAADLTVADAGDAGTAASLGLAGSSPTDTLSGAAINTVGRSTALASLNDGNGVRRKAGSADLRLTAGGTTHDVNLDGALTVGDAIDRINDAAGGAVTASVASDGRGIQLDSAGAFSVADLNASGAAEDLGVAGSSGPGNRITGGRLLAAPDSKLLRNLNGGSGVDLGTLSITNRAGATTSVDLSSAASVSDVINTINDSGAGVTASLNQAGNGLLLTDATGGSGALTIGDASGAAAADLHLAGTFNRSSVDSGDLQLRYVTEGTRLDDLGVARGKFRITDSTGATALVDLTQGNEHTVGDVIDEINSRGLAVKARVNDGGDGIQLQDTGPGTLALKVEEAGSTTADDLGLLGEAASPGQAIDGSFSRQVEVAAGDTLQQVADKINEAGVGVSASIINDGSAAAPFRLALSADHAGSRGAFVLDDAGLGLDASNLADAQDAVVFYGSSDPAKALTITSDSNTLDNVIPGASIDLHAASDQPVQVTLSSDNEAAVKSVQGFVDAFNKVISKIDKVDTYDAKTKKAGILLGDASASIVRSRLFSAVSRRDSDLTGEYNSLAQVGVTVGKGSHLQFDPGKFKQALHDDPEAVRALFTFKDTKTNAQGQTITTAQGIGGRINDLLDQLTDGQSGPVQTRVDTIEQQIHDNKQRIQAFDQRLADKRQNLEQKFANMEKAISRLQSQSGALGKLSQIAAQAGGNSGFPVG